MSSSKLKIILFGPPGVGKTTVGKLMSKQTNLRFYDGDKDMTRQWMRDFLDEQCHHELRFILVRSLLAQENLEGLIHTRRENEGHPITLEAFRKFTLAFEIPTNLGYLALENPQSIDGNEQLKENIRELFFQLTSKS